MQKTPIKRVIILPGNGCTPIQQANWYGPCNLALFCRLAFRYTWLQKELQKAHPDLPVMCETMPDPYVAAESVWIPFTVDKLGLNEDTLLIGHSSGAACAMRIMEKYRVKV